LPFAACSAHASFCDASDIFEFDWNSMFTSASGRCSGLSVPSARGMP
jgi:hypothetical protein